MGDINASINDIRNRISELKVEQHIARVKGDHDKVDSLEQKIKSLTSELASLEARTDLYDENFGRGGEFPRHFSSNPDGSDGMGRF